ncbi:MAG: hypothetical protein Sylvanvirus43_4 [Sylvanvirus sp.]|uniref:Uncharacterized protein n=1 Tax=Sylvanvirus sp. TaxID=2487774 RepID=A0A3G5AJA8_9VIRU|nr:MAG: hypothetical protein Sylvanvirus43_4 [Sylvanvirus sp.]
MNFEYHANRIERKIRNIKKKKKTRGIKDCTTSRQEHTDLCVIE